MIRLLKKNCYKEKFFLIELLNQLRKVLICFVVLILEMNYLMVILNKLNKEYL